MDIQVTSPPKKNICMDANLQLHSIRRRWYGMVGPLVRGPPYVRCIASPRRGFDRTAVQTEPFEMMAFGPQFLLSRYWWSNPLRTSIEVAFVCLVGDLFTDSTHFSPPFGEHVFPTTLSKSKIESTQSIAPKTQQQEFSKQSLGEICFLQNLDLSWFVYFDFPDIVLFVLGFWVFFGNFPYTEAFRKRLCLK